MHDHAPDAVLNDRTAAPARSRALLVELYDAAVAGAAPGPITADAVRELDVRPEQRLSLFAFGKAAHPMASAAVSALRTSRNQVVAGVVVAPEAHASLGATITSVVGDHPVPGPRSMAAAERIAALAPGKKGDDVALVLISGGATSLIGAPLPGMAESDLVGLYELLLGSGLDIREMNAVRKRFARWGAGRLAVALAPARTHALLISDVESDDPADIASGPCTPDSNSVHDVSAILERTGLYGRIAAPMREYLAAVARRALPTPRSLTSRPASSGATGSLLKRRRAARRSCRFLWRIMGARFGATRRNLVLASLKRCSSARATAGAAASSGAGRRRCSSAGRRRIHSMVVRPVHRSADDARSSRCRRLACWPRAATRRGTSRCSPRVRTDETVPPTRRARSPMRRCGEPFTRLAARPTRRWRATSRTSPSTRSVRSTVADTREQM